MKLTIILIIITICSVKTFGQVHSFTIDSLTMKHLESLPSEEQKHFKQIVENRSKNEWLSRIDTSNFDYAFIEETYCFKDKSSRITERYFYKTDSIPKKILFNGQYIDPKTIYNDFRHWYSKNVTYFITLNPLFDQYSSLKPMQELPYDKRQLWSHGCVIEKDAENQFKGKIIAQLKTTYQIQTMIDRINHKTILSIQLAPKMPTFETVGYNGVWDW